MPRQLPWANKIGGSRTLAKPTSSRQVTNPRTLTTIDDDFFDGTVLASSNKRRGASNGSDDDLPDLADLPAEPSTPRTKAKTKDALRMKCGGSSSPPPVDDVEKPLVEGMHKCVSKFDLRDDEWMMVEDEFLETAKLFTRHLHIAEYEKLKATIEEKKKDAAEVARPVVADAKRSTSGAMKEKARVQALKQKKAIRDVFASQEEEDQKERTTLSSRTNLVSSFIASRNNATAGPKPVPNKSAAQDSESDSDDLDAPRLSAKPASKATTALTAVRKNSTVAEQKSASSPAPNPKPPNPTFAKPAPPTAAAKSRSRISCATPFEMLDDWVSSKSRTLSASLPKQPAKTSHVSRIPNNSKHSQSFTSSDDRGAAKVGRSTDSFNEHASTEKQSINSGGVVDRLAKRKAEQEKDEKERKRKAAKLDDIPTFLF
jgi:hypothetical protein